MLILTAFRKRRALKLEPGAVFGTCSSMPDPGIMYMYMYMLMSLCFAASSSELGHDDHARVAYARSTGRNAGLAHGFVHVLYVLKWQHAQRHADRERRPQWRFAQSSNSPFTIPNKRSCFFVVYRVILSSFPKHCRKNDVDPWPRTHPSRNISWSQSPGTGHMCGCRSLACRIIRWREKAIPGLRLRRVDLEVRLYDR